MSVVRLITPQRRSDDLARSELDLSVLCDRVWTYGTASQVFARQVRLLPDGRISGYRDHNEASWAVRGPALLLIGRDGVPTARLDRVSRDEFGLVLSGPHLPRPEETLVLAETTPAQTLASAMSGFPIDARRPERQGKRRRNLVIVFGNQRSLHLQWPRTISDEDRTWDLCVSFYGPADQYEHVGAAEFSSLRTGIGKCMAAHAAFATDSPFWEYERVWFADDDLMLTWGDINALFATCEDYGLELAQPSLAEGSYVAHRITRQQAGRVLRYTSFVESMAPVFTNRALRLCAPVFQGQRHGYGIDYVWPWLLGAPRSRMAVIDKVGVLHLRAQTKAYDAGTVWREEELLLGLYGVRRRVEEFGFIADVPG